MLKRRGFTLIELLVVIAIIGILAAMLFPVFARARESARKTQCLANVKNIAIAMNMYLTDYDKFWPGGINQDQAGQAAFDALNGGDTCWKFASANPYLRAPVILDEYTKNRDIWKCPSERAPIAADWIVAGGSGVWWQYLIDDPSKWGNKNGQSDPCAGGPCCLAWPPGWGGDVTDSVRQRKQPDAGGKGVFDSTIGWSGSLADASTSRMQDPSLLVVCADTTHFNDFNTVDDTLYWPCATTEDCACGDWSSGQTCRLPAEDVNSWKNDPTFRKQFARHMGGSNFGFADGHAKWIPAEEIRTQVPYCICCDPATGGTGKGWYQKDGKYRGFCPAAIDQTF